MRQIPTSWFLVMVWFVAAATAQIPCDSWLSTGSFPGANGSILASVVRDPDGPGPLGLRLVVAGSFSIIASAMASGIAEHDPATGVWTSLGDTTAAVRALAVMPNGDLIAAGDFTSIGNVQANCIARWNGVSWASLGAGLQSWGQGSEVRALALMANGDLVVGGNFMFAGAVLADGLARWNGAAWSAYPGLGPGLSGGVRCIAELPNGDLAVGGGIVYGLPGTYIARWNGSVWSSIGGGTNGPVVSLTRLANGDLLAGGYFTIVGGVIHYCISRWDGSTWSPLGSGANDTVSCMALHTNGDVLVGGMFTFPGNRIARWDGSSWSPLGQGLPGNVSAIAILPNGDAYAAGSSATGIFIARWDGVAWAMIGTGPNESVQAVVQMPNGNLVAGGSFMAVGGVVANAIARWDGASWTPLGSGFGWSPQTPSVRSLAVMPNGDLIAGGYFTTAGGFSASYIARWDGSAWSALGGGMDSGVEAVVAMPTGDLVAAGWFSTAGGVPANAIARWNGAAWSPIGAGAGYGGSVRALAAHSSGAICIACGGASGACAMLWNGTAWVSLGTCTLSGSAGNVRSLAWLPDGRLAASGFFTAIGGVPANGIAVWDGSTWGPLGSSPGAYGYAIAPLANGDVVVGGYVNPTGGVGRWNGTAWVGLGAGVDGVVQAMATLANGDLAIGGTFITAGGLVSPRLAVHHFCLSSYQAIGAGCPGSLGVPGNEQVSQPRLGSTLTTRLTRLPANAAFQLIGWSSTSFAGGALPYDLTAIGMPGCWLRVSGELCEPVVGSGNAATWSLPIPNAPAWIGASFFTQAVVLDAGANALGLTLSDAAVAVIGT